MERQDQQIGKGRQVDSKPGKPCTADEPSKNTDTASGPRTSKNWHSQPRRDDRTKAEVDSTAEKWDTFCEIVRS